MNLVDQRLETLRVLQRVVRIDELRRGKIWLEIAIEQRAHSRWQNQRREKSLVHLLAADDVKILFLHRQRANRGKRQVKAVRQFFLAQEGRHFVPIAYLRNPLFFVSNASGILSGRNQRALIVHQLDKIEAVVLRDSGCIAEEILIWLDAGLREKALQHRESAGDAAVVRF